jgi:AcrR family transcriptional regulator
MAVRTYNVPLINDGIAMNPSSLAPSRSDRRRNKTRRMIAEATLSLITQKGVDETTIEDISEQADVAQRTFYNYFDSKIECIETGIKQRFLEHAVASDTTNAITDPVISIAVVAMNMMGKVISDPVTQQLKGLPQLLTEAIEESQRDMFVGMVAEAEEAGKYAPAIDIEDLGTMLSWSFIGFALKNIDRPSHQVRETWARFVLDCLGISKAETDTAITEAKDHIEKITTL